MHLLVDFAGVIGHHQRPEDIEDLACLVGLPVAVFEARYWACRSSYDAGSSDLTYWSDVFERPVDDELLRRLVEVDARSWTRLDASTVDLFSRAATQGSLSLLSNAPSFLARRVEACPELDFFDAMTFSCDVGIAKPDSKVFAVALEAAGARAEETVFVDDREENVAAAERMGMRGILFRDTEQLQAQLSAYV